MIQRNYICQHEECKQPFTTSQHGAKFCSVTCKSAAAYSKRKAAKVKRRKLKMPSTGFYSYLLREVRRAGSVEVLTGLTSKDLSELLKLRKELNKAAGFENGKVRQGEYELSHICPVKGTALLGLLHPANLVITSVSYNRKRGSSYSGGGKFVERSKLQDKWKVTDDHTDTNVYSMIQKFLGNELNDFLAEHVLSLTQRQTLINKLAKLIAAADDVSVELVKDRLSYYKNEDLTELATEKELKLADYSSDTRWSFNVAFEEAKRFESYGVAVNSQLLLYADYLYRRKENSNFSAFDHSFFLEVHGDSNWFSEEACIFDFLATQLTRDLHREKIESRFDGRLLADCFSLPECSTCPLKAEHPLEQYLVAHYGDVPLYCGLAGYYAGIEKASQKASADLNESWIVMQTPSVKKFLSQVEPLDAGCNWEVEELSEYGLHYCPLRQFENVFFRVDENLVPF